MGADPRIRPAVVEIERPVGGIDHAGTKLAITPHVIQLPDLIAIDARGRLEPRRFIRHERLKQQLLRNRELLNFLDGVKIEAVEVKDKQPGTRVILTFPGYRLRLSDLRR